MKGTVKLFARPEPDPLFDLLRFAQFLPRRSPHRIKQANGLEYPPGGLAISKPF